MDRSIIDNIPKRIQPELLLKLINKPRELKGRDSDDNCSTIIDYNNTLAENDTTTPSVELDNPLSEQDGLINPEAATDDTSANKMVIGNAIIRLVKIYLCYC